MVRGRVLVLGEWDGKPRRILVDVFCATLVVETLEILLGAVRKETEGIFFGWIRSCMPRDVLRVGGDFLVV